MQGPAHNVDIDIPTVHNSPIYKDEPATLVDAAPIITLRAAGQLFLARPLLNSHRPPSAAPLQIRMTQAEHRVVRPLDQGPPLETTKYAPILFISRNDD
jgi:hypothetical protein